MIRQSLWRGREQRKAYMEKKSHCGSMAYSSQFYLWQKWHTLQKQFSVFSLEKSGDYPGLLHETSNTKWRGGHLRLTQQTNDKDRMRTGVSWPIVECSRLYEKNPPLSENKFRFWILAVAHFTYGSRDLNFYLNIRWIYCMIWNFNKSFFSNRRGRILKF